MKAPINKFFDITPTSKIISRFNDDMNKFTEIIHQIRGLIFQTMHCITVVYIVSSAIPEFHFIWPFCFGYVFYIYRFSQGSYREIHRLLKENSDIISNHYSESMSGNSTIRAFDAQDYQVDGDQNNVNVDILGR